MPSMNEVEWSWSIPEVENHIRNLPLWQGELKLERRWGGLQNRNWVAEDEQAKYMVRQAADLRDIWGTVSANRTGMLAAAKMGVSPKVVYDERLLQVSEFIEGRNFEAEDMHKPENVTEVIRLIKILQAKAPEYCHYPIDYFWPFDATRQAGWIANHLGCKHMAKANEMIEIVNTFESLFGPYKPVLCHGDMAYVNIMQERESGKIWLIDYDLCGWGLPEWDIAEMCAYSAAPPEIDELCVREFFGAMSDTEFEERLHKQRALRMTSSVRIALLAWVLACGSGLLSAEELKKSMNALFGGMGDEDAGIDGMADYFADEFWRMHKIYGENYK